MLVTFGLYVSQLKTVSFQRAISTAILFTLGYASFPIINIYIYGMVHPLSPLSLFR